MCYFPLTYDYTLILVMFYIKMSCIIVFLTNFELVVSYYSSHNFSKKSKNYIRLDLQCQYTPTLEVTKFPLHKSIEHQNELFQPQMRKITSGYHNYLLTGLNLLYIYFSPKQFVE